MRCSGDSASPSAHAAALNRLKTSSPATAHRSVLQLQKRYGNRYVQRVLAIARQGDAEAGVAPEIERAINSVRGGGQVLDSGARTRMESAFGADFGGVRVHTSAQADFLNQSLSARAFTTGQDIFFRQGEYRPGNSAGQELLAHELTHVVQQSGAGVQGKLTVSQPGDALEREADSVAKTIMRMPESKLQAGCTCGGLCRDCQSQAKQLGQQSRLSGTTQLTESQEQFVCPASLPFVHKVYRYHEIQRAIQIPAAVAAALAAAGRFLLSCIIGAAFGVGLDYVFQRGMAWWRDQPFRWNTCFAIISGVIGCVSAGVGGIIARALFRSTGGHLEEDLALRAVVWFLTWLYSKFPVVPVAIILKQLAKLGCVDSSELPPGIQAE